jgi:(p)ppGpp synthase/HD superfamily hydrolase
MGRWRLSRACEARKSAAALLSSPVLSASSDPAGAPTFLRDLALARRAYSFACEAHRGQRRESDAAQFIIHPLEVAALLHITGHRDDLVAAAILHDTIENSAATAQRINTIFGGEITRIVAAMTEDPTIESFDDRKAALRQQIAEFGPDATAVYAADKVAKVRELRSRATRGEDVLDPGNEAARSKLEHYLASLVMLEQITPKHPLVRQLRFELEVLRALPPQPELIADDD